MTTLAKRRALAAVLTAAAIAAAGPALADASSAQYTGCDGYGAAASGGDGMTSLATVLFIFSPVGYGNTAKGPTQSGMTGVADCDAALSDLPEKHWMRKVSLLRARAMHKAEASDIPGALADLDLAKAASKDDAFFARSLGLGMDLVHAYILRKSGDQAGAEALAMQAIRARPYNRQVISSAIQAMGHGASAANLDEAIRALSRLVPQATDALYLRAFDDFHYSEVATLYTQLAPPHEIGQLNISSEEMYERAWRDLQKAEDFWAVRGGMYAYALAALGRSDDARKAIADARTRLAADTAPPPPLDPKDAADRTTASLHQGDIDMRLRVAVEGTKILDEWSAEVERRILVTQGKPADAIKVDADHLLLHDWASVELLDAAYKAMPPAKRPKVPPADAVRAVLKKVELVDDTRTGSFMQTLPDAETADRVPPYANGGKPLLAFTGSQADLDAEGYRVNEADGMVSIRIRGTTSTPSIVEEMALLRAADLARQGGHKGIIVVARADTVFTVTQTYYGTPLRTDPNGFSTSLDVVFVDPKALPDKYRDGAWRVIDADDVYDRLAPLYIPPKKRN